MKRLILATFATLPFITMPMLAKPAVADVIVNFSSSHRRPVRTHKKSYPIKTGDRKSPVQIQRNRRVRQRRSWVSGRWQNRQNNARQVQRVWVPGHYEIR